MPRAATILIIGVAVLLVGGFGFGILVGRKPPPAPTASESLPPADPLPPQQASATIPPQPLPSPPAPPPSAPAPTAAPPAATPAAPPLPSRPLPSAPLSSPAPSSLPPSSPPTRPEPAPIPQAKPLPPPPSVPAKPAPQRQAAAAPAPRRHPAAAPKQVASVPRKPKPSPALPQPVGGGRWVVQLGAFQSDDHAKLLVDTLAYHGHAARIAGGHDRSGRDWYFVQTPGYATREDAETVARRLARTEHVPTYVFETRSAP
jgi:cell division protein FtsN